jgi:hypothetical protein
MNATGISGWKIMENLGLYPLIIIKVIKYYNLSGSMENNAWSGYLKKLSERDYRYLGNIMKKKHYFTL